MISTTEGHQASLHWSVAGYTVQTCFCIHIRMNVCLRSCGIGTYVFAYLCTYVRTCTCIHTCISDFLLCALQEEMKELRMHIFQFMNYCELILRDDKAPPVVQETVRKHHACAWHPNVNSTLPNIGCEFFE